jgi:hypothetical protein
MWMWFWIVAGALLGLLLVWAWLWDRRNTLDRDWVPPERGPDPTNAHDMGGGGGF